MLWAWYVQLCKLNFVKNSKNQNFYRDHKITTYTKSNEAKRLYFLELIALLIKNIHLRLRKRLIFIIIVELPVLIPHPLNPSPLLAHSRPVIPLKISLKKRLIKQGIFPLDPLYHHLKGHYFDVQVQKVLQVLLAKQKERNVLFHELPEAFDAVVVPVGAVSPLLVEVFEGKVAYWFAR